MNHDDDWEENRGDENIAMSNTYYSQRTHKRSVRFVTPAKGLASTGGRGGGDCGTIDEESDNSTFHSNTTPSNEGGIRSQAQQQQRQLDCNIATTFDGSANFGVAGGGRCWEEIPSSLVVDWKAVSSPKRDDQSRVKLSSPDSTTSAMRAFSTTVEKSSETDLFAWNDDHHRETSNKDDAAVPSYSSSPQWKLQNESATERQRMMSPLPRYSYHPAESNAVKQESTQSILRRHKGEKVPKRSLSQQRLVSHVPSRDARGQDPLLAQKLTRCSFSDGDVSDMGYGTPSGSLGGRGRRRSRIGFLRSKSPRYNSEGERSDSDWESSAKEDTSKGSTERGRKKTKKYPTRKHIGNLSQSPRRMRLFGQKNHHYVNADSTLEAEEYLLLNDRDVAQPKSSPFKSEANKAEGGSNASKIVNTIAMEPKRKGPTTQKSELVTTTNIDSDLNDTRKQLSDPTVLSTNIVEDKQQPNLESDLNHSSETQKTSSRSNKSMGKSSMRHHKEAQSLHHNNSRDTQMTSIRSSRTMGKSSMHNYREPQSLPNHAKPPPASTNANQATPRITPRYLGPTTNVSHVRDENYWTKMEKSIIDDADDVASSLGSIDTETLGSLVTMETSKSAVAAARSFRARKSKAATFHDTDASMVSEINEIEKLRKENDRLREELENASQLSSTVSQMYAESLKLENERLRVSKKYIYKSTLETLLEEDNKKLPRKSRVRRAPSAQAITEFDHLLPIAHLINGVDFDDDSITTFSTITGGGKPPTVPGGCETSKNILMKTCSRIATTTVDVASHMKTALNQENQDKSCGIPTSRPMDCFNQCSSVRRRTMDSSVKTSKMRKKPNSTRASESWRVAQMEPSYSGPSPRL
ncbi:hypothetical protein ACHAW5_002972 [Stephanodiscus triporus]|uniref:BZIP domain-containing protein n=1 Tax=Stephanodiscus triporus TaxID=2934178 RepID=A0ABD3PHM4_9STRA